MGTYMHKLFKLSSSEIIFLIVVTLIVGLLIGYVVGDISSFIRSTSITEVTNKVFINRTI